MSNDKQTDLIDLMNTDFDPEGQESEEDLRPFSPADAVTWSTDWTTETILLQLKRKTINLNPAFQRRNAWRPARKSRFIESLMLGYPIPQLVLAESKEKRGTYIVLDGKQRLLTLQQFCSDESFSFSLTGLEVLKSLNGTKYSKLQEDPELNEVYLQFLAQTIRTVVIKNWPSEDYLYSVFLRLNTGSVPLSPQELRQALHPGPFISYLDTVTQESNALRNLLGIDEPDFRMRDVEIALRHIAFKRFAPTYRGNLKRFLDDASMQLNENWATAQQEVTRDFEEFEHAINAAIDIFGENAFCKFDGRKYEARLNRAVMDVVAFYLSDPEIRARSLTNKSDVEVSFKEICTHDDAFRKAIESTTKSLDGVRARFSRWAIALSSATNLHVTPPQFPEG